MDSEEKSSLCSYIVVVISIVIVLYWAGVDPSPLVIGPVTGLLYQPWLTDGDAHNCNEQI
jgi:hypothetical protein